MANNPADATSDDFLQEILGLQSFATPDTSLVAADAGGMSAQASMLLHLRPGDGSGHMLGGPRGGGDGGRFHGFPLGLSFEQDKGGTNGGGLGFLKGEAAEGSCSAKRFREDAAVADNSSLGNTGNSVSEVFHCQPLQAVAAAASHPPPMRPRVRARRGQATDPHSIAERLRRERIAERIKALQELVPSVNKTDRAAMLDEIVDYVKFLRLQVKVLSMSRLGGAGAVAPLVTDIPLSSAEEEEDDGERNQPAWDKWSSDGTERQVAKLMEENVGAAMQFLQSKALCIMPISLASAIFRSQQPEPSIKSEANPPS